MEYSTYPYAPVPPGLIPARLMDLAFKYGVELAYEHGKRTEKTDRLSNETFALQQRVEIDLFQLESVTR
jgi:hypothetical protein